MKYGQDGMSWLINSKLDNIISMSYTNGTSHVYWWQDEYRIFSDMLNLNNVSTPKDKVYMGIGWYQTADYTQDNLTAIVNEIKGGRIDGLKGMVIFEISRYDSVNQTYINDTPLVNALTVNSSINGNEAPFASQANSCLNNP